MMNLQYNGEAANTYMRQKRLLPVVGNEEGKRDTAGSFLGLNKKGPTTNVLIKRQFTLDE